MTTQAELQTQIDDLQSEIEQLKARIEALEAHPAIYAAERQNEDLIARLRRAAGVSPVTDRSQEWRGRDGN